MKLKIIIQCFLVAIMTVPVFSEETPPAYSTNPQSDISYSEQSQQTSPYTSNPQSDISYANQLQTSSTYSNPQTGYVYTNNPNTVTYIQNGVQNVTDSTGTYTYIVVVRLLNRSSVIKKFDNITGKWEPDIPIPTEFQQNSYSYRLFFPKDKDNKPIDNKLLLFVLTDVFMGGDIYLYDIEKKVFTRVNQSRVMFDYTFSSISIIRNRIILSCNNGGAGFNTFIIDYGPFINK